MKNKVMAYSVLGVVFALFNVLAFAIPTEKTVTFWIAYAFTVVAFGLQIGVWKLTFKGADMHTCGDEIEHYFGEREDILPMAAEAWKLSLVLHKLVHSSDVRENKVAIASYERKIYKYDPTFKCEVAIELLTTEIEDLKKTIVNTPTTFESIESSKKSCTTLGAVTLLASVVVGILGVAEGLFPVLLLAFFGGVAGIILLIAGTTATTNDDVTSNLAKVQAAKEKLKDKQEELDKLQPKKNEPNAGLSVTSSISVGISETNKE